MPYWAPQAGPQALAATCPADIIFFGGSRGGGKSDCLIGRHLRGVELYGNHWSGLIIRKKYKDFAELRRRWDELIMSGLPAERVGGDQQTNYIRFNGMSASITMAAINQLQQVDDFIGHQYPEISVDEATTFAFFTRMIDKLRGSNRSPHGVPCHIFATGNPGGPGHIEVKDFFQLGTDGVKPKTVLRFKLPLGLEESRVFIPSFLKDNRILYDADPKYVARLLSIKDPALKRAWIEGDWDVYIGQAFNFSKTHHVIEPFPIPEHAVIYMTMDWGFGAPFSIGWWWIDADNRVYRFNEWYGWDGTPNQGLRLEDSDIAKGIIRKEKEMGIDGRKIMRISGSDCFNKKPDYRGGGQGPSTAEVFRNYGVANGYKSGLVLRPADEKRTLKIRQFRERLRVPKNKKEMPMMMIYSNCKQFIRTIPALCVDEDNPEYIDTDMECHAFDESCHICMARPLSIDLTKIEMADKKREKEAKRARLDSASQAAWSELDDMAEQIEEAQEW